MNPKQTMENHFNDVHSNKDVANRISGIMGCTFRSIKGESCIKGYMNALRYAQCKNIEFFYYYRKRKLGKRTQICFQIFPVACSAHLHQRLFTVYAYRTMTRFAYRPFGCFRPGWIINIARMPNAAAVSKNYRQTKINTNMIFWEWFSGIIGCVFPCDHQSFQNLLLQRLT